MKGNGEKEDCKEEGETSIRSDKRTGEKKEAKKIKRAEKVMSEKKL